MFTREIILKLEERKKCEQFAQDSAPTQREHRSGGALQRNTFQIQMDTFRGKVAEVVAKKFLEQEILCVPNISLDFAIYPRGKWDEQDFVLNGKRISIKSAKWFSKWLLLEMKDVLRGDVYDCYIFITIDEGLTAGSVRGFATKKEILQDVLTLKLKKGDLLPGTSTTLDADNYARHSKNLHNQEAEWIEFAKSLK